MFRLHGVIIRLISKHIKGIWHSEDRASRYILLIKANEMHYFSNLFDKELYILTTIYMYIH